MEHLSHGLQTMQHLPHDKKLPDKYLCPDAWLAVPRRECCLHIEREGGHTQTGGPQEYALVVGPAAQGRGSCRSYGERVLPDWAAGGS